MSKPESIERLDTDWGFVLISKSVNWNAGNPSHTFDIECFGMAGLGRYEIFRSYCGFETVEEAISEAEQHPEIGVYKLTKSLFGKYPLD